MSKYKCRELGPQVRRGFTLLELMVVVVIIGLLAGIVAKNVVGRVAKAKVVATRAQITNLESAVLDFKIDTGQYPASLEDLVLRPADVSGWQEDGYLLGKSAVPLDKWKNEFIYQYPGDYENSKFDIISLGADGEEGGEGEDLDLYNSDVEGVTTNE